MPASDLPLLTEAAREAGAIAMSYFRRAPKAWDKPGEAGPVTEADLAVDARLREDLTAARPDYGWLSEETPDDRARLDRDRVLIADPIDGTRAFIAGEPGWCVALAVVESGRVTAAAAYMPARDRLYAAALGRGATCDGAPIAPSEREAIEGASCLTGAPQLDARHWPGGPPPVRRRFRPSFIARLCAVAEGAADAALTFRPTWEWDCAAGDLIAREAGCVVTDGDGASHVYNSREGRSLGVIAAPPALHAALMTRRRPSD